MAPAMNVRMWQHPATQRNLATAARPTACSFVGPDDGEMACGEFGPGPHGRAAGDRRGHRRRAAARRRRWPASTRWSPPARPPSRSIRCASSPTAPRGKQGYAIAEALAAPRRARSPWSPARPSAAAPAGRARSSTSRPRARCWRPARRRCRPMSRSSSPPSPTGGLPTPRDSKIKKGADRRAAGAQPGRESRHPARPSATCRGPPAAAGRSASPPRPTTWWPTPRAKRARKGCDWIVANDVSPATASWAATRTPWPSSPRPASSAGRGSPRARSPSGWPTASPRRSQ